MNTNYKQLLYTSLSYILAKLWLLVNYYLWWIFEATQSGFQSVTLGYILQLKSVFINTDLNNQFSSFDQLVVQKLLLWYSIAK